jgi:hypothetical protein
MMETKIVAKPTRARRRRSFLPGAYTAARVVISLSVSGWIVAGPAHAASTCEPKVARIVSVQGTVEAKRAGTEEWQAVARDDAFCAGDTIRVQPKSRADVMQRDETLLRLAANTTITIEGANAEGTSVVDVAKGAAHFLSRSPARVDVQTPFTVAGIRGTEFFVRVAESATELSIFEGTVVAANDAGSLTLTGG